MTAGLVTREGVPLFGIGAGDPARLTAAIDAARKVADPADRAARLFVLGDSLAGCGEQWVSIARTALQESTELGNAQATARLGVMLASGEAGPPDVDQGLDLMLRAHDLGLPEATLFMGRFLVAQGKAEEAVGWFHQALARECWEAGLDLALLYYPGQGLAEIDMGKAVSLLSSAANHDVVEAQHQLSPLFRSGAAGQTDLAMAEFWEARAVDGGSPDACLNRAARQAQDDAAFAVALLGRAAAFESAEAAARLCLMYLDGIGVESNEHLAGHWFQRASELGYDWRERSGG